MRAILRLLIATAVGISSGLLSAALVKFANPGAHSITLQCAFVAAAALAALASMLVLERQEG